MFNRICWDPLPATMVAEKASIVVGGGQQDMNRLTTTY
jgi:hypothetical protein